MLASWSAIGLWFGFGRPDARAAIGLALDFFGHATAAFDAIARVAGTGFGLGYAGVAGVVSLILFVDIALLFAIVFVRGVIRPRLAAHLARSEAN